MTTIWLQEADAALRAKAAGEGRGVAPAEPPASIGGRELAKLGKLGPPAEAGRPQANFPNLPNFDGLSASAGDRVVMVATPRGVPEEWAQGVADLLTRSAPETWPADAWETMRADALRFLREHAAGAAGLGWTTAEVWGAHRSQPWQRIDVLGLIPLLKGGRVLTVHSAGAVIEMRSGSRITFYRGETPGTVPVWAL